MAPAALSSRTVIVLAGVLAIATACSRNEPGLLRTSETGLRSTAVEHPQPDYPASSLQRGSTGVAVVAIRVGTTGDVERVNVLQAPDPDIAASLRQTLRRWRFLAPQIDGSSKPQVLDGKLTFYFQIRDGRPVVDDPPAVADAGNTPRRHGWVLDAEPTSSVSDDALAALLEKGDAVLVDVANRDASSRSARTATHIPLDELSVRAPQELPRGKAIVLECVVSGVNRCAASAAALHSAGFADVRVWQPPSAASR